MRVALDQLAGFRTVGTPRGMTSVCSAHPMVLRAALRHGRATGSTVLIEATCNQVNHLGGYTGMTPADFVKLVFQLADEENCPRELVVLGGDHLGPNPWRDQDAETAMIEAEKMVAAYIAAGFGKIHLDASMGCRGEPQALDDATTASRAARLAVVAEAAAKDFGCPPPLYIIGTEVPPPGGADHLLEEIAPTVPNAVKKTLSVHRTVFAATGLEDALERVIGVVVQPGVEFGNHNVIRYQRNRATQLVKTLDDEPTLVFEAHSTDYQGVHALSELVEDGFAILKVGPELTFVLREALYALDLIATDLVPNYGERTLKREMEQLMLAHPQGWRGHYDGSAETQAMLRHYSLSDRIRYYWTSATAKEAVERLLETLKDRSIPLPLLWQHMPDAAAFSNSPFDPTEALIHRVTKSLRSYHAACNPDGE